MNKLINTITRPIVLASWWQDLLLAIPRLVCAYFLTTDFGSAKFGLPWSPRDNNLGFFEVAFWFPSDVAEYGGIFAMFPVFFAWMGAFSEAVGGIFYSQDFKQEFFPSRSVHYAGCHFLSAIQQRHLEYVARHGIFMGKHVWNGTGLGTIGY